MIRKYISYYILSFIIEGLIGVGSLWFSVHLGNAIYLQYLSSTGSHLIILSVPQWLYKVVAMGVPCFLYVNRAHSFPYRAPVTHMAWPTAKAIIQLVVLIIAFFFVIRSHEASRLIVILFGLICYAIALLKQIGFELLLARSQPHREILLIGNTSAALEFLSDLRANWPCGVNFFGLLTDEPTLKPGDTVEGVKIIGRVKIWEKILVNNQIIDEVVIFPNGKMGVSLNNIIRLGQELQVRIRVAVGEPKPRFGQIHTTLERFGWANLISFQPNPDNCVAMLLKRTIDRVASALLLILFSPLFIVLGILIKLGSRGPIIFPQERTGFRGLPFKMYKFRTMYVDAESEKERLMAANEMNGPVFKIRNDPRITSIGRVLRRFSLDELPQIINVLKGDMSLVGPRPLPIEEAAKCDRWEKRRFSIKPGITCLWQINGRNMLDFPEWMKLDLDYVNNWSLVLDFKILLKTFGAVINGRGAY